MKSFKLGFVNNQHIVFIISIFASVAMVALLRNSASAATLNVVAGTDAIEDNNQCQLSEAIQNINDQAQTNDDCLAGDGNNDTIDLPSGTVTLTANLPKIRRSVTVQGQGMSDTTIDGVGQFEALYIQDVQSEMVTIRQLTVQSFKQFAVFIVGCSEVLVSDAEVDGQEAVPGETGAFGGIMLTDSGGELSDIYIHGLTGSNLLGLFGISVQNEQNSETQVSVTNVTIQDFTGNNTNVNGIGVVNGLFTGSLTPATTELNVTNTTISNLEATGLNSSAGGITALVAVGGGESSASITVNNSTIQDLQASNSLLSAGITTAGAAIGQNDVAILSISGKNNLIAGQISSCNKAGDIAQALGGPNPSAGTITETITSLGGNISDDESCNDYFNQSSDKNNITNLSDYLGDIANNGGPVPTMALLPGNPAIDGGVCGEGVPSTDARGIARPQGTTCDSGAFEVEQATPTGTISGDKAVALNVPTGVVVNEFGTVSGSIPSDNRGDAEYEFPLGLLSFELGVVEGSTNEISLDFESDLDPASVVARKYNPSDQTFTTLTDATITKITKDNKPTLRLTYAIKDGEFPDLDNQANGTITDPIGLATEKKGVLANTGDFIILAIPLGLSLLLGVFTVTYIDYRKHKKPLQEADKQLAKTYTYWHHLKTVTIPLFSYRLSFGFERREHGIAPNLPA